VFSVLAERSIKLLENFLYIYVQVNQSSRGKQLYST